MGHPFFCCYHHINPAGIRMICHRAINIVSLSCGDILFSNYECPAQPQMYFVINGLLNYRHEGATNHPIEKSQWVTEAVLWTAWIHCGTLHASTDCKLLLVNAEAFTTIISPYPSRHPYAYAGSFVHQL